MTAYPQTRVVMLSRNFGHQAAVTAGLTAASGECAVIIDADLQDPPEVILQMIDRWQAGYEVVYGVRETRAGESGFKLRSAQLFYRLINKLSDVEIPLDSGDFRLLDRRAVNAMLAMPERHRLLRGMSSWIGFRQFGLKYARAARFAGTTKYPLRKMINLALDGIFSFSTVPLRSVTVLGGLTAAAGHGGHILLPRDTPLHPELGGRLDNLDPCDSSCQRCADVLLWHSGRVHWPHLHRDKAAPAVYRQGDAGSQCRRRRVENATGSFAYDDSQWSSLSHRMTGCPQFQGPTTCRR
jgi:hypothetical protein